jgi:predicted transcriptional regulator
MRDLFSGYPDAPGYKEGTTSRAAAEAIAPRAGTLRARALVVLKTREATPDEIALAIGETVLAMRPRITELYQQGLIERTGEQRLNKSGCFAHVYRIRG